MLYLIVTRFRGGSELRVLCCVKYLERTYEGGASAGTAPSNERRLKGWEVGGPRSLSQGAISALLEDVPSSGYNTDGSQVSVTYSYGGMGGTPLES